MDIKQNQKMNFEMANKQGCVVYIVYKMINSFTHLVFSVINIVIRGLLHTLLLL